LLCKVTEKCACQNREAHFLKLHGLCMFTVHFISYTRKHNILPTACRTFDWFSKSRKI
jgi:hypothetical protein